MFFQYFDTVGWVFWPVKTVASITYTELVETLNHDQSVSESEHTLNGTSLQFGYTVPFTSVHHTCWKIRDRRQSKKRTLQS